MSITVDLTCFSFSCSDLNKQQRENINFTNKIRLPPSVLNTLMNDNGEKKHKGGGSNKKSKWEGGGNEMGKDSSDENLAAIMVLFGI